MDEQEFAIVRGLVPVAWADGDFAETEKQMIEALLDAYNASPAQKKEMFDYAKEKRTLEDIHLQDLSSTDRRVLLQHAVLLSFADGHQSPHESTFLNALIERLRIPKEEADSVVTISAERAKKSLNLL